MYKKDSLLWEAKETASITTLTGLPNRRFVYSVGNGTLGVYETTQRLWRVKVTLNYRIQIPRKKSIYDD